MNFLTKMQKVIDSVNEFIGKIASYTLIIIMLIGTLEVIMRYFFNSPTIWAWGVNIQLFAFVAIMSGAASLRNGYFINVEVFYNLFPIRIKLIVNILTFIFASSLCIVLIWQGWEAFYLSWQTNEHYTSYYQPPAYPVKFLVPLGGFLLLMQSINELIRPFLSQRTEEGGNEK